jgi:scyllo-inositol 2-dehydrogenase (NADP+)
VSALRVALVGYGTAGSIFHAPLIAATPGLTLASVVTGNPERQRQARRDHPSAQVLASVEQVWAAAAAYDLVVVAAPNRAHVPLGLAALGAGLPVVIDKPLATTSSDGRKLAATAKRRGLMLTVFHNRRWDGDMRTLQGLLNSGVLGSVIRFESRYERWRPVRRTGAWREAGDPAEAGGLLFDLGSHLIDQAMLLFGRPTSVYAELDRRRPGAVVDDDGFVALEHRGGVRSHLWTSAVAAQPGPRMRVLGLKAAYVKHGMDVQEDALRAGARPIGRGWGMEPREAWGVLGAGDRLRRVRTLPGDYRLFYKGVVDAMRRGAPPPVDPVAAIAVLEVIEAARRSAGTGAKVRLRA